MAGKGSLEEGEVQGEGSRAGGLQPEKEASAKALRPV